MKTIQRTKPVLFLPLLLFWVLASSAGASTQPAEVSGVEVGDRRGNYVIPGSLGEIPYRVVGGRELLMDAFSHPEGPVRPGVLLVHGGGWTAGSRQAFITHFQEMLTAAGYNWFALDYRLAPEASLSEQIEDVAAAVGFIRRHADFFRLDPGRLILLGEDTGALLAARAASELAVPPAGTVLVGGIFDLESHRATSESESLQQSLFGSAGPAALRAGSLSVIAERELPPTLIVHGTRDSEASIESARTYCERLAAAGNQCELVPVEGGIHRSENWTPAQQEYRTRLTAFLERVAPPAPPVPGRLPARGGLTKGIVFADGPGYGPGGLGLDAYQPEGEGPFPAVIVVHGGGWEAGSRTTYVAPVLAALARAGFAWFSIDYRLTPEHQNGDQLDDVRRAVRFVRHHAAEFRVDPSRLALLGESAGGQLVVQVGALPCPGDDAAGDPVDREPCDVSAIVSLYGVYDFLPMVRDASPRSLLVRLFERTLLDDESRDLLREYSPFYNVHAAMPPLLLIHGTNEFLWDQAVRLAARLDELGAQYRLVRLEGAPHGMENWEGRPEWENWKSNLASWLRSVLN